MLFVRSGSRLAEVIPASRRGEMRTPSDRGRAAMTVDPVAEWDGPAIRTSRIGQRVKHRIPAPIRYQGRFAGYASGVRG